MAGFSLLSAAFYVYFGAGSVAIGYLLLRLTYPEVRTMDFNQRLGVSALSGVLLSVAAFAIDYSFDAADVMQRQGFFPLVLFLLLLASFAVLKIYFALQQSQFLTIGIPMASPMAAPQPVPSAVTAASPAPIAPAAPPSQARPPAPAPGQAAPISLDFGKFGKQEEKPLPQPAAKQSELPRAPVPARPAQPAAPLPPQKPLQIPLAISPPAPRPPTPAPAPAPAAAPSRDKKSVILKLRQEEAYAEPKPSFFQRLFGSISPKRRPAEKKVALPKSLLKPEPARPPWAQAAKEAKAARPEEKPAPAGQPQKGYLATITGIVEEGKQKPPGPAPEPELPKPEVLTLKPEPAAAPGEHVITTYRGQLRAGQPPQPQQTQEDAEAEEMAKELAPQAAGPGQPAARQLVHRRYMVSREGVEQQDISVIADKSAAGRKEFDGLVADVYSQLKENEKPAGIKSALAVNAPPAAEKQKPAARKGAAEEKPALTFDDLVKGTAAVPGPAPAEKPTAASEVFAKLRGMSAVQAEAQSKIEFVKVSADKTMGCPTCHSKSSKIIFCPYCGSGMCANCSPKIKPFSDQVVYTCPKCAEEVTVKKRF